MSAVLLAIFTDYSSADRVRMELFREGFPTDRYELTASCEPGRAAFHPDESLHGRFVQYFGTFLTGSDERHLPEQFAHQLDNGCAAITVHPRGPIETLRASEILAHAHPATLAEHDISKQAMEHAAARRAKPWVSHLWVENHSNAHCIYCRLFERDLPS